MPRTARNASKPDPHLVPTEQDASPYPPGSYWVRDTDCNEERVASSHFLCIPIKKAKLTDGDVVHLERGRGGGTFVREVRLRGVRGATMQFVSLTSTPGKRLSAKERQLAKEVTVKGVVIGQYRRWRVDLSSDV